MSANTDTVLNFIARSATDEDAGSRLTSWMKGEVKAGNVGSVADLFPSVVGPDLDYTTATALHRILKRVRDEHSFSHKVVRIAVLGTVTTHQLIDLLDLYLHAGRLSAQFYESDYGTLNQEFLDPTSGLHAFRPELIMIVTSWRDLARPSLGDTPEEVRNKVDAAVKDWATLWRIAREQLGCQLIQSNYVVPPWTALGNLDARHHAGFSRFVSSVNRALGDRAPSEIMIHDVDQLAAAAGRLNWADERFFHQAKLPCAPEHLVAYAHSLASIVLPQFGMGRKCLVLDLDNTLWGGVIGDDGLGGIRLGQGDPESEGIFRISTVRQTARGTRRYPRGLQQE